MEHTQNYNLPQWAKSDRIMMDDFNAAMSSIESGMSANAQAAAQAQETAEELPYVIGTYAGDGSDGRSISLGFRPSFIIINGQKEGYMETGVGYHIIATAGTNFSDLFTITDDGFWVRHTINYYPALNAANVTYDYIAFR